MDVCCDMEVVFICCNNVDVLIQYLQVVQDCFEVGEIICIDVVQVEVCLLGVQVQLVGVQLQLFVSCVVYECVMGELVVMLEQLLVLLDLFDNLVDVVFVVFDNSLQL